MSVRGIAGRTMVVAAFFAMGCGYTSEYVAPKDGRVRPVWKSDNVVLEKSGAYIPDECVEALNQLAVAGMLSGKLRLKPPGDYWKPAYYGPPIGDLVAIGMMAPVFPFPPVFFPPGLLVLPGPGGLPVPVPVPIPVSSSNSNVSDAASYFLILALIVLPVVDLLLASLPPESASRSSKAIDWANAFNDLSRVPGNPCSYVTLAPIEPLPPPPPGAP